jgi:hypothetical protein
MVQRTGQTPTFNYYPLPMTLKKLTTILSKSALVASTMAKALTIHKNTAARPLPPPPTASSKNTGTTLSVGALQSYYSAFYLYVSVCGQENGITLVGCRVLVVGKEAHRLTHPFTTQLRVLQWICTPFPHLDMGMNQNTASTLAHTIRTTLHHITRLHKEITLTHLIVGSLVCIYNLIPVILSAYLTLWSYLGLHCHTGYYIMLISGFYVLNLQVAVWKVDRLQKHQRETTSYVKY